MSKVTTNADPYVATVFVTGDQLVKHYGINALVDLPTLEQQRYTDYVNQANKQTETTVYRFIDTLPLETTDEANTYAQGMAFYYAIWLKQADDGANNVASIKEIWENYKEQLIEVLKSQPKSVNTRTLCSNAYPDSVPPYSQSWGLSDIL